jgi:hypothetical protein
MTARRPIRGHIEASTIAFTQFIIEGASWNVTMREGATAEQTLALLAECRKVQAALTQEGAICVLNRDATETMQRRQVRPFQQPPAAPSNGNGHSKAASVKTAAWLQAGMDLAARCPCYVSATGRPNYRRMTEVAGEHGFGQISDDNIAEVLTALEEAAQDAVPA